MDDRLEQMFQLRPMIQDCLLYRASISEYQRMMKQAMMTEMKNLFNVEMIVDQIELKLLRKDQLPPIEKISDIGSQCKKLQNKAVSLVETLKYLD